MVRTSNAQRLSNPAPVTVARTTRRCKCAGFQAVCAKGEEPASAVRGRECQCGRQLPVGNLAPGRYYLSATDNRAMMYGGPPERPGRKGPEEAYVTTYFPGVLDASSAAPVDITAGAEVRGIQLRLRKARMFHIRGKALNAVTGGPAQSITLMLAPQDKPNSMIMFRPTMSMTRNGDGSFEFNHVLPGSYVIQSNPNATMNGERSTTLVARQVVTVSDESIEDVVVPLAPGIEITGTIRTEGVDPRSQLFLVQQTRP